MAKKFSSSVYRAKRRKLRKYKFENRKKNFPLFKWKRLILFRNFIRRKLRKNIRNYELLKYPIIVRYFNSLKF